MSEDLNLKRLELFVQTYEGPKLAIVATGGAAHLADLAAIPGASAILHGIQIPYSEECRDRLFRHVSWVKPWSPCAGVGPEAAAQLLQCARGMVFAPAGPVLAVVVTAALTTTRYRKGKNHAYILWQEGEGLVNKAYLELPKLSEEVHATFSRIPGALLARRQQEDWDLTHRVLELVKCTS